MAVIFKFFHGTPTPATNWKYATISATRLATKLSADSFNISLQLKESARERKEEKILIERQFCIKERERRDEE